MSESAGAESGASADSANSRVIVLAGVLLGGVAGAAALASGLLVGRLLGSSVVMGVVVVLLLILVFVVASNIARGNPNGARRSLAAGVDVGVILLVVPAVAWGLWSDLDPFAMTPGQVDDVVAQLTSQDREGFYLGDEVAGHHLEQVSDLQPDGVLFFRYGRCLDHGVEGECNRPLTVTNQPTTTFGSRGETASGCKSLPSVLGVPAAKLNGDLLVFTGSSIVTIMYFKVVPGGIHVVPVREAAVATRLRPVGHPGAVKALPPPDAETEAFARKHCGHAF